MKLMKSQKHTLMYQNYHLYIGKDVSGVVKFLLLAMIDELEARVNRDLENDIVAVWHDETQINKYFFEKV